MGDVDSSIDLSIPWYSSDISYSTDQEGTMAALALAHNAASTFTEDALMKLMVKITKLSSEYIGQDSKFRPPRT